MAKEMGSLIYKCRLCGASTTGYHVPDVDLALSAITGGRSLLDLWPGSGFDPGMFDIHVCGDGRLGVADFVGVVRDKTV